MDVTEGKSFADVLANRHTSQAVSNIKQQFQWKTGKVRSLKKVDRPVGCNGKHCEALPDRCQDQQCIERVHLQHQLSTTTSENDLISADIRDQLASIDQLLRDISVHCRTDDMYYPGMEESRMALEAALRGYTEASSCACVACQLAFKQKEAKVLKEKAMATKDRLTIMREYRRANDKETLERTSSNYMKGGKYFTPIGGAKGKGVKALRPTLQMQSSYDVVTLTTNSMKERPLVGPTQKKNKKKR